MYRRSVAHLKAGMVLAQSLYTERSEVLLAAGTELTPPYIEALGLRGFASVYIRDGLADDVAPADLVSEQVRATTAAHVGRVFELVALSARGSFDRDHDRPRSVRAAVRRLGPRQLDLPHEGVSALELLYRDIESIIDEIVDSNTVAGLESLKSHSNYTFQHSVDVAIVGILLGKQARLTREQIRELALGCLVHDIGKMYIDVAIVDKPTKLTDDEFEEIKKHPRMGFELVRRMPVFSILPAHVAYQHHERQDGTGYPRGLIGENRVVRTMAERLHPKRMLLIAEIGAVADVYSALSSDRPYRPAFPLDRVAWMLRQFGGHHLNRELVRQLLETVPVYPIGHWIEVVTEPYRGWRGVVTHVEARALDRPTVRLLMDQRGELVTAPIELDLQDHGGIELASIAPGQAPFLDDDAGPERQPGEAHPPAS